MSSTVDDKGTGEGGREGGGGAVRVTAFKQTAVSHDYIVWIAPCLDRQHPSSSHLRLSTHQISCEAAESERSQPAEPIAPGDEDALAIKGSVLVCIHSLTDRRTFCCVFC